METENKIGRPSSYKPEYAHKAEAIARLGATDADLADISGVDERTINRWKLQFPEFCQSLKSGKAEADDCVERALYQRAVGYEQDAVKIFMPKDAVEPVYAPYRERIAGDVTACIFWLKNRRPDEWREKVAHEHAGTPTLEQLVVTASE